MPTPNKKPNKVVPLRPATPAAPLPSPKPLSASTLEKIVLTPESAAELLNHNTMNRPLRQPHVNRIAAQIASGKWQFNGDTIKISQGGDVLDGQHRLWAIMEAKVPVETIVVRGIERDAFATMDAVRQIRTGADTVARLGQVGRRNEIATALTWLTRWQRDKMEAFRDPRNRIENSDIEEAFKAHPQIVRAVERCARFRGLVNVGTLAFTYYVITNRKSELAERMLETLENPTAIGIDDPFFRLRSYFVDDRGKRKEPLTIIAYIFKAANAAAFDDKIRVLKWSNQGTHGESFPKLKF
jgi:hypothetical protein